MPVERSSPLSTLILAVGQGTISLHCSHARMVLVQPSCPSHQWEILPNAGTERIRLLSIQHSSSFYGGRGSSYKLALAEIVFCDARNGGDKEKGASRCKKVGFLVLNSTFLEGENFCVLLLAEGP